MKNRIDRTSENLAEMRDRTTDPQLKELLETALDALEDVGARLDELELEQENYWSNQLVELTLTPSQAATLLYCLKKQAITTDEGAIESLAVERSQLLEKFTPEQLGKQLMSEELNLIAN